MSGTMLETLSTDWSQYLPGGNSTSAAAPTQATRTSTSSPSPNIPWGTQGSQVSNALKLLPFGVGADTNTFLMYVFAWEGLQGLAQGGPIGQLNLWIGRLLGSFTCELDSGLTPPAGTALNTGGVTNYLCSAITLGVGNQGVDVDVISPGHGSYPAHIVIDVKGARFVTIEFNMNSSATSANCLYARI